MGDQAKTLFLRCSITVPRSYLTRVPQETNEHSYDIASEHSLGASGPFIGFSAGRRTGYAVTVIGT